MLKGKEVGRLALIGALAVAPLGMAAVAADSPATAPDAATTPPPADTATSATARKGDHVTVVEPSAPPQAKGTLADLVPGQTTAEDIIGKPLVNAGGKTIGDITDIVLDKDRAVYAVLSVGGFLGIGADSVAVPFDRIRITATEGGGSKAQLVADVTADDLKELATQQHVAASAEVGRSAPAPADTARTAGGAPAAGAPTQPAPGEGSPAAGTGTQVAAAYARITAEDLIGKSVVNAAGETVGTIDDLVIDDRKMVIAVISVGGFLGVGARDVAVPLEQLQVSADKATLMSSLTRDDLEKMPAYEKGTLKDVERGRPLSGG